MIDRRDITVRTETIMDGIERWSREQAENVFRLGGNYGPYEYFVFVNYYKVSTKAKPMSEYQTTHDVGLFLVAIDLSDCRHVLCGFRTEVDRDTFLATSDILSSRI